MQGPKCTLFWHSKANPGGNPTSESVFSKTYTSSVWSPQLWVEVRYLELSWSNHHSGSQLWSLLFLPPWIGINRKWSSFVARRVSWTSAGRRASSAARATQRPAAGAQSPTGWASSNGPQTEDPGRRRDLWNDMLRVFQARLLPNFTILKVKKG